MLTGLLALCGAGCAQVTPGPPPLTRPVKARPLPRGTFIQEYLVRDWTDAQWMAEYRAMREVGMDTLVFGSVADSAKKVTYYPTAIPGYSLAEGYGDTVDACLRNAKKAGIKVFLGLNFHPDWWRKAASDPEWLYGQMREGNAIADELYARYHAKYGGTLHGWYWVWEVDNINYNRQDQREVLANALDLNVRHLHELDPAMPVMLCPFMNYRLGKPEAYRDLWTWVFAHCSLGAGDIFAPQDCVGAGGLNIDNFVSWLAALKQAVDTKPGLRFWTDSETFVQEDWTSATLDRFVRQLTGAQPYVERSITFAYSHYYSPNNAAPGWQKTLVGYVKTGKLERTPPTAPSALAGARVADGVRLAWKASQDNVGVAGYHIFRNGVRISRHQATKGRPVPAPTFTDTKAPSGPLTYTVQAYDFAGNASAPAECRVP